ncbi:hypothetical protein AADZ90_011670 [Aestuariibius sp. 2305UL40-4]|uniref:hypothetical protein n=1 Tax=Aestuariibius violaceus TaxID=3234132 RepID=UPI003483F249
MSSGSILDQQKIFNDRVKRINNPRNKTWTDPETGIKMHKHRRKGAIAGSDRVKPSPIMAVVAALLAFAVTFYLSVNTFSEALAGLSPEIALGVSLGAPIVVLIALRWLFAQGGIGSFLFQVVLIVALSFTIHNAVHVVPQEYLTKVFPEEWVATMQADTEFRSVRVGTFFTYTF